MLYLLVGKFKKTIYNKNIIINRTKGLQDERINSQFK